MLRTDFALFREDGSLTAVVEAKRVSNTSAEWAALFRRNILAHGGFASAEFFLIVTPDSMYLWEHADSAAVPVPPDRVIPTRPLLEPYFSRAHATPESVSGSGFEMIVWFWLSDLSEPGSEVSRAAREHGFSGAGLVEALHGGRIEYEAAA